MAALEIAPVNAFWPNGEAIERRKHGRMALNSLPWPVYRADACVEGDECAGGRRRRLGSGCCCAIFVTNLKLLREGEDEEGSNRGREDTQQSTTTSNDRPDVQRWL